MVSRSAADRRAATRQTILLVAREHAIRFGWRRARVQDIAGDAGISRPTLYKEFPSKLDLGHGLIVHEMLSFLARLERAIAAEGSGVHARIYQAMLFSLTEVERNPLLEMILNEGRSGDGSLLPSLTDGQTDVTASASATVALFLAAEAPDAEASAVEFVATICVRLAVSFLVDPPREPHEVTAQRVADLCTSYLSR